jgi:hypothetical protein
VIVGHACYVNRSLSLTRPALKRGKNYFLVGLVFELRASFFSDYFGDGVL